MADVSEIVAGKRTKKTVERLEFQISKPKEKLKVEDGETAAAPEFRYCLSTLRSGDVMSCWNNVITGGVREFVTLFLSLFLHV